MSSNWKQKRKVIKDIKLQHTHTHEADFVPDKNFARKFFLKRRWNGKAK